MIQIQNESPIVWNRHTPPPVVFTCDRWPRIRLVWQPDNDRMVVSVWHPADGEWRAVYYYTMAGQSVEQVAQTYFESLAATCDDEPGAPWKF